MVLGYLDYKTHNWNRNVRQNSNVEAQILDREIES